MSKCGGENQLVIQFDGSSTLAQTQNPYKPQKCGIFLSIFSNYMLCGVVFCAIIKYEDLV